MLLEDLKRNEHLVYVDTAMNLRPEDDEAIRHYDPFNDQVNVYERSTQIAQKAHGFLERLNVSAESQFSDTSYLKHLQLKA